MGKNLVLCVLTLIVLLTFGCSSKHYVITTKNGTSFVTTEEPRFDKKKQTYYFEDLDGKKWTINREELQSIEQKKK